MGGNKVLVGEQGLDCSTEGVLLTLHPQVLAQSLEDANLNPYLSCCVLCRVLTTSLFLENNPLGTQLAAANKQGAKGVLAFLQVSRLELVEGKGVHRFAHPVLLP